LASVVARVAALVCSRYRDDDRPGLGIDYSLLIVGRLTKSMQVTRGAGRRRKRFATPDRR
jgi:hypothetical protein